jgi:hypothetical protein
LWDAWDMSRVSHIRFVNRGARLTKTGIARMGRVRPNGGIKLQQNPRNA